MIVNRYRGLVNGQLSNRKGLVPGKKEKSERKKGATYKKR